MYKNYLKIAIRQLWKHKLFSALNIFGLATSMSICLLVIMTLIDQYGYDSFHTKSDQIYRIITSEAPKEIQMSRAQMATTAVAVGDYLNDDYPELEQVIEYLTLDGIIEANNKGLGGNSGAAVVPEFFDVFDFPFIEGEAVSALSQPRKIVLTESTAEKYFGELNPIGQTIEFGDLGLFEVTGILKDTPRRSHIQFDFLISHATLEGLTDEERESIALYDDLQTWRGRIYFLAAKGVSQASLSNILGKVASEYSAKDKNLHYFFEAQPLEDIMPGRGLSNEIGIATPREVLYFLIALGIIIIVSACFNYTSLSIARSIRRAKEIGVRKVSGARKQDIIAQFLGESIILSVVSLVVAIGFLELLIPLLYGLDPFMEEVFYLEKTPKLYLIFFGFSLAVGFLAGFYPAFNISKYKPIQAIRQLSDVKLLSQVGLRKALVTIQLSLSLIFILTVVIVLKQQRHILSADLGSRTENLLNVRMKGENFNVFAQQVRQLKGVDEISSSAQVILTGERANKMFMFNEQQDSAGMIYNEVSSNYVENLELNLLAGAYFPDLAPSGDEKFAMVNETAAKRMGYNNYDKAVGNYMFWEDSTVFKIIGVVKDFNHNNLWFDPVENFVLVQNNEAAWNANITFNGYDDEATLAAVENIWKDLFPDQYFTAFFTSDRIYYLSKFFRMGSQTVGFVGLLTIIIACMGLLGMVLYSIEGRIKEVGIRKVLGASINDIIWHLSKGYFILIAIAIVIAIPITWLGANLWLQNFVLRISITPALMLVGVFIIAMIGSFTVVSQTYLAAKNDPINALRTE
ncbi:MAG: FtsX-like permease family protein [Bacteroidota bacterium]